MEGRVKSSGRMSDRLGVPRLGPAAPGAAARRRPGRSRTPIRSRMRTGATRPVAMDPVTLRNRLLVATGMWREISGGEALPKLAPGDPAAQVEEFELLLVDKLWALATPENAREVADRTWDLVHDRPERDRVRKRVVECHEALARISRLGD